MEVRITKVVVTLGKLGRYLGIPEYLLRRYVRISERDVTSTVRTYVQEKKEPRSTPKKSLSNNYM